MKEGSHEKSAENRSEDRYSRTLIAHVQIAGGAFEKVHIQNFSASGFQASAEVVPKVGDAVVLKLANLKVYPGTVIWVRDREFGVNIDSPIDTEILANR